MEAKAMGKSKLGIKLSHLSEPRVILISHDPGLAFRDMSSACRRQSLQKERHSSTFIVIRLVLQATRVTNAEDKEASLLGSQ